MPRVELHPHVIGRMPERDATEAEIIDTVLTGECCPVKFGRMGFRKTFRYDAVWRGRRYAYKELEAIAVEIPDGWLVLTAITRYF